jgi:epoxyqueuosine reductase
MDSLEKGNKILLHSCCAPCAAPSAERLLKEGFTPILFYSNPNIAPEAEWKRRLDSLKILSEALKLQLIIDAYDHRQWLQRIRGYEASREGGQRCTLCFYRSLTGTAEKAAELQIPQFTTSLTLSPYKDADRIFTLGKEFPSFLPRDFKKKDGVARSVHLSKELGLYRQNYCGCEFSLRS